MIPSFHIVHYGPVTRPTRAPVRTHIGRKRREGPHIITPHYTSKEKKGTAGRDGARCCRLRCDAPRYFMSSLKGSYWMLTAIHLEALPRAADRSSISASPVRPAASMAHLFHRATPGSSRTRSTVPAGCVPETTGPESTGRPDCDQREGGHYTNTVSHHTTHIPLSRRRPQVGRA